MRKEVEKIFVTNTFTTDKELAPYLEMAEKYGYQVVSAIIENRHGHNSVHNVPDDSVNAMRDRFAVNLG